MKIDFSKEEISFLYSHFNDMEEGDDILHSVQYKFEDAYFNMSVHRDPADVKDMLRYTRMTDAVFRYIRTTREMLLARREEAEDRESALHEELDCITDELSSEEKGYINSLPDSVFKPVPHTRGRARAAKLKRHLASSALKSKGSRMPIDPFEMPGDDDS